MRPRAPQDIEAGLGAAGVPIESVLDEGRTFILHCHLLSFIGIHYTKKSGAGRNDSTTLV